MDSWYFAYGSNLWTDQMLARTGSIGDSAHKLRIARLANFRLVFRTLETGGPAYANILSPGDGVVGVVYRLSAAALATLDRYEGGYNRQSIQVTDEQGEVLTAIAYVMRPGPGVDFGQPSAEYLKRIVTGARQHSLPEQYMAEMIDIAAKSHEIRKRKE